MYFLMHVIVHMMTFAIRRCLFIIFGRSLRSVRGKAISLYGSVQKNLCFVDSWQHNNLHFPPFILLTLKEAGDMF